MHLIKDNCHEGHPKPLGFYMRGERNFHCEKALRVWSCLLPQNNLIYLNYYYLQKHPKQLIILKILCLIDYYQAIKNAHKNIYINLEYSKMTLGIKIPFFSILQIFSTFEIFQKFKTQNILPHILLPEKIWLCSFCLAFSCLILI